MAQVVREANKAEQELHDFIDNATKKAALLRDPAGAVDVIFQYVVNEWPKVQNNFWRHQFDNDPDAEAF